MVNAITIMVAMFYEASTGGEAASHNVPWKNTLHL